MTIEQFIELRKRKNMSRPEMAEIIGVTPQCICRWERTGKFNPHKAVYEKIMAMDDSPKIIETITTTTVTKVEHGINETQ